MSPGKGRKIADGWRHLFGLRKKSHEEIDFLGNLRGDGDVKPPKLFDRQWIIVREVPRGQKIGESPGLLLRHALGQKTGHPVGKLADGFFGDIGQDQGLVVDLVMAFALEDAQDGGGRELPDLGVNRTENRVFIHHDLRGGQRDQGSAAHGEVGNEHCDGSLPVRQGMGDLHGGQNKPPRRMNDEVDRGFGIGHLDRTQDLLGVLNVDVAKNGKTEKVHRLLPVDEGNGPRPSGTLEVPERLATGILEHPAGHDRLDHHQNEKKPYQISQLHASPQS